MNAYGMLLRAHGIELLRDKLEIVWTLIFPLVVLFVFGFVTGSEGFSARVSIVVAITLMQLNINAGVRLLSLRDTGALKTLGATPLRRPTFLASEATYRMLVTLAQSVILVVAAMFFFDVRVEGNPLFLAMEIALGSLVFFTLGYALASIMGTATVAGNAFMLLTFLFIIFSGLFFSLASLPNWASNILQYLPLNQNELVMRLIITGQPLLTEQVLVATLVELGYLALFGAFASRFRWSS